MAKVAAFVAAYSGAHHWLHSRLDNLLAQSLVPTIILVCQEGSPEHDVAREYGHCTLVITQDAPPLYAAWNLAIQRALELEPGLEYLASAHYPCRYRQDGIEKLVQALDGAPGFGLAYADFDGLDAAAMDEFDLGLMDFEKVKTVARAHFQLAEGGLERLLASNFVGPICAWRAELHERFGFFDEEMHLAGDYEMWMRLASQGVCLYHISEVLGLTVMGEQLGPREKEKLRLIWESARAQSRYRPPEQLPQKGGQDER